METRSQAAEKIADNCVSLTQQKLTEWGWLPVEQVNGTNIHSWEELNKELIRTGKSDFVQQDWLMKPLIVENQQLFTVNPALVENIGKSKNALEMLIHLKRFNKGESSRVYGKITSADDRFTSNSSAYSFDLNGLAVFTVPNSLQLTKLDAIAAFGKWFTGGHIETGGDDSVTHVPLGKKLMIIAERGIKSRNLEKLLQSSQAVLNFLTKGPQSPSIREKVRFYFTTPSSLMIQPALCAHTVITMSTGASLVAGFEAKSCKDDTRQLQVFNYYSSGLPKGPTRRATQSLPYASVLNFLRQREGNPNTDIVQHMECFAVDGKNLGKRQLKPKQFSFRRQRSQRLPRVRAKWEKVKGKNKRKHSCTVGVCDR